MKTPRLTYSQKPIIKNLAIALVVFVILLSPMYSRSIKSLVATLPGFLVVNLILWLLAFYAAQRLRDATPWIWGEMGEWFVSFGLKKLPKEFIVLRRVNPKGGEDIDFVVIGSTGLWIVEAKAHSARVLFDGKTLTNDGRPFEKDFIAQVERQKKYLKEILKQHHISIEPQPIIVFASPYAKVRLGMNRVAGVYVVRQESMRDLIKAPTTKGLIQKEVEDVARVLKPFSERGR